MADIIEYELWLDESGSFSHEDLAVKDEKYSLIGGILIEKNKKENLIYKDYPDGHFPPDANAHGREDRRPIYQKAPNYLLILNKLRKDTGCIEVFFENSKYDPSYSPTYLYLRMLVQGVFAVYRDLYWKYNKGKNKEKQTSIKLKVLYAEKDSMAEKVLEDYKLLYIHEIESKKDYKKIIEKIKNNIEWEKGDANPKHSNANKELLFADLACYTRYNKKVWCRNDTYKDGTLTSYNESSCEAKNYLNRDVISGWLKNEEKSLPSRFCKMVHGLYSIIYDSNANAMRCYMLDDTVGYFSEIMELLSEKESKIPEAIIRYIEMCLYNKLIKQEKNDITEAIIDTLKNISYRNNKTIIKNLISRWSAIEQNTNNYLSCVEKLKKMLTFVDEIKKKEIDAPFDMLEFELHTLIADCYLRSNDNKEAEKEIEWCSNYINSTNPRHNVQPETIFHFYEKQSLGYIDKYQYEKAIEAIREAEKLFSPEIEDVFHGEYYGDALCMHILALMPLIRTEEKEKIYKEIIYYSDIALKQYIDYPGELERHLQYRSLVEAENGNPREALNCLLKAKFGDIDTSQNYNELLPRFINKLLTNEDSYSIQWYLLYYLVILANVSESKKKENLKLRNIMIQPLLSKKELLLQIGVAIKGLKLRGDYKIPNYVHPLETVYWKLAYCLSLYDAKEYAPLIRELYTSKIITKCKDKDIIRWIPIEADRLLYEIDSNNGNIKMKKYNSFIETIKNGVDSMGNDLKETIMSTINNVDDKKEVLVKLSRLLPY